MLHAALLLSAIQTASQPVDTPGLVVLVTVDQMIPEQLDRLEPWLEGGLGRFARGGRVFRAAELGYARTETGPGHVTLSTGTYPNKHGVVGNAFFDRESRTTVYCVGDETVAPVTSRTGSGEAPEMGDMSPRNIRVPALGDYLSSRNPESRIVSIAGKDRAAVGMGGHEAQVALWWDRNAGGFRSSTYYGATLPEWVAEWNRTWIDRYADFARDGWRPLAADYPGSGTAADRREGEMSSVFRRGEFPYVLPALEDPSDGGARARGAAATFSTPLVDQFVLSMARTAVETLALGQDGAPDLLAIGLSACDVTGHAFGPYSPEVTDVLMRADRELADLFDLLDERLGPEGWIACLSADHGVLDLPEGLVERGVDAERLGRSEVLSLRDEILAHFGDVYGSDLGFDFIGGLVFDPGQIAALEVDPLEVWGIAAEISRNADWIARAYTFAELRDTDTSSASSASDPLRWLMARSVAEGRGPDVSLVRRPWTLLSAPTGTSHGSPYPYDRRIPLVFLGPGFAPGISRQPAGAVDAAPTLLDALGVEVPAEMDGRVLDRR